MKSYNPEDWNNLNQSGLKADQAREKDRELIELLRKECVSPIKGIEDMQVIPYAEIMEEFGTTDLKAITESEKYKRMLEKGFIVGSGEERIYYDRKPGMPAESEDEPTNLHLGVDYMVVAGTDITSIFDGEVINLLSSDDFVPDDGIVNLYKGEGGYGNMLLIKHKLPDGQEFYSLYGHLADSDNPEKTFKIGDTVRKGGKIGEVGKSFSIENGGWPSHLHFAIMKSPDDISGYGSKEDAETNIIDPANVFVHQKSD